MWLFFVGFCAFYTCILDVPVYLTEYFVIIISWTIIIVRVVKLYCLECDLRWLKIFGSTWRGPRKCQKQRWNFSSCIWMFIAHSLTVHWDNMSNLPLFCPAWKTWDFLRRKMKLLFIKWNKIHGPTSKRATMPALGFLLQPAITKNWHRVMQRKHQEKSGNWNVRTEKKKDIYKIKGTVNRTLLYRAIGYTGRYSKIITDRLCMARLSIFILGLDMLLFIVLSFIL